jgi:SARP family transcriptional regulator, regulator of embCAB operon
MEFRILGSLGIVGPAVSQGAPTGGKVRTLMAQLLIESDRSVSIERLTEELWPSGAAPRTAPTAIQVYVSKLRRFIDTVGGPGSGASCIVTRVNGYQLTLANHGYDYDAFRKLVDAAREADRDRRWEEAAELLRASLDLWLGEPLSDVQCGPALTRAARVLKEARMGAYERRVEIELRLGRQTELIGELFALVSEFPFWERVYIYLMIALYRSGRTAEALDVYRRLRQRLVEELGMEPGGEVSNVHTLILGRDPQLDAPGTFPMAS